MSDDVKSKPEDTDDNIVLDVNDDDWAWRRKIRANPTTALAYRIMIGVVGLIVVVVGVILLPLPGPGWLIIFLGIGVWATEFEWAQRLLDFAKRKVKAWTEWISEQAWWVKAAVGLGTALLVAAVFYVMFLVSGVPTFLPDAISDPIKKLPGLG